MTLYARVQNNVVVNIENTTIALGNADPELIRCPVESELPTGGFNAAMIGSSYDSITGVFSPPSMSI